MESVPSIDLTQGDLGLWILWVCFPALALTTLKRKDFVEVGWRGAGRAVFSRILIGLAISTIVIGSLAVWQRLPPQFFIRMRVSQEVLILGFRWPKAEVSLRFGEIKNVSITSERSLRRGTHHRINIHTSTETIRSYGYRGLTHEELAVLDDLRSRISANAAKQTPPVRLSE